MSVLVYLVVGLVGTVFTAFTLMGIKSDSTKQ